MSDRHPSIVGSAVRRRQAIVINVLLLVLSSAVGLALMEGLLVFFVPPPFRVLVLSGYSVWEIH